VRFAIRTNPEGAFSDVTQSTHKSIVLKKSFNTTSSLSVLCRSKSLLDLFHLHTKGLQPKIFHIILDC